VVNHLPVIRSVLTQLCRQFKDNFGSVARHNKSS